MTIAVVNRASTHPGSVASPVNINLPASLIAGNYIIMLLGLGTNVTATLPTGWTQASSFTSSTPHKYIWWKVSDGTEGSTVSVTISGTAPVSALTFQVSKATGSPIVAGSAAAGTGTAINPPAVSGLTSTSTYLIFGFAEISGASGQSVSSYSTNYSNGQIFGSSIGTTGAWSISEERILTGVTSEDPANITTSASAAWNSVTIALLGIDTTDYTLAVDYTSFALSSAAIKLKRALTKAFAYGSFALSGIAAGLHKGRKLASAFGSFVLSGQAVRLSPIRELLAAHGSYVLSGEAIAGLLAWLINAEYASLSLSGKAAGFLRAGILSAVHGVYTLTGKAASFVKSLSAALGHATFSLTGESVGVELARLLTAVRGLYALVGQDVILRATGTLILAASYGTFALTGIASGFHRAVRSVVAFGSYVLDGISATFRVGAAPKNYSMRADTGKIGSSNAWHSPIPDFGIKKRRRPDPPLNNWK
jgi:hypothetical protein